MVVGPDGVGKSTLAHQAAQEYGRDHPSAVVRWVTGTATEHVVPFGAFSHLVHIAEIGKPAALLRNARLSLQAGVDDLLVVDDANQLDPLSATLVYQLALAGEARMIVTVSPAAAPAAITALWTDDLLTRIEVAPAAAARTAQDVDPYLAELPSAARAALDFLAVCEETAARGRPDGADLRRRAG